MIDIHDQLSCLLINTLLYMGLSIASSTTPFFFIVQIFLLYQTNVECHGRTLDSSLINNNTKFNSNLLITNIISMSKDKD